MAKKPYNIEQVKASVANRIKQLRIERGYSSYETFALDNDIDRKQYWRMENGSNITLKSLVSILNIHKISLEEFFSEGFN